ncbi:DUF4166 domain-containing protein [Asticcacaulis benevestitus]|uniref:DUF4166 domain-containing protein n=1 Tax=Asticcacaulis benevestitus DSM 16100 = ATCC BAA-896 TaxID=1121022 RepID=V4Q395_9CAUL|nr:DUF4166 domain-containing protein [Asticcacaulis benevestitus]ESQ94154.1 hypothetical protein ABENE_03420 [Asticcacaulis benevestitus DSM 16100 = ATCC BAA-896]
MKTPIFAAVFAEQWDALPPALKAHYANRGFTRDRVTVTGTLTIRMGPLLRFLSPLLRLSRMLTPWPGDDVPCTVAFHSEPDSNAFIFERRFSFPGRAPHVFRSKLVPQAPHHVIEYMASGLGWRCGYSFEDGRVRLFHKGYVWRLFGVDLPVTFLGELLAGKGFAFEEASGDMSFSMAMGLKGGPFGRLTAYSYSGDFTVTEMALDA